MVKKRTPKGKGGREFPTDRRDRGHAARQTFIWGAFRSGLGTGNKEGAKGYWTGVVEDFWTNQNLG